ncbi:MAG: hypothetical protein CXR31_04060 [Geobacter sp.]|nr:MAG: hypothetical protein CXR31_04060 [Geobacter sp.]
MKKIGIIICARYQDCGGGTHPIPLKYLKTLDKLSFWDEADMKELAGSLMTEHRDVMESYD